MTLHQTKDGLVAFCGPVDKRPGFDYSKKSLGACYRPQVEPTTLSC